MPEEQPYNVQEAMREVSVGGDRFGYELRTPGQSFDLKNLLEGKQQSTVFDGWLYIRTTSGNIYRIDDEMHSGLIESVRLINGNESKKRAQLVGVPIPKEQLEQAKITIGKPFTYGKGSTTTPVTEVVFVRDRLGSPFSGQGRNSVVEDFRKGLPRIPMLQPGLEGEFDSF